MIIPVRAALLALAVAPTHVAAATDPPAPTNALAPQAAIAPADDLVASTEEPLLRDLLDEILQRNPAIRAARARSLAARQVAPQVTALPDPMLGITAFVRSPDGRQGALEYSQEIPGAGKRRFSGESAVHEAAAAASDLEALRLRVVTEARELLIELARLDEASAITREERSALEHFEDLSRARYEAGDGLQHDVVRLQAEITRSELDLVEIESERLDAMLALNALRGYPGRMDAPVPPLPEPPAAIPDWTLLSAAAAVLRPELQAASERVASASSRIELARRGDKPDISVSGGWMLMEGGGMSGKRGGLDSDEFMLGVGIRLPVRGAKIAAALEQSVLEHQAALAERDDAALAIDREAARLASRWPLVTRRLSLNEGVLGIQADETLRSSESAYSTGLTGSLELLDAEREVYGVQREVLRARAELALLVVRIEGVAGAPLWRLSRLGAAAPRGASPAPVIYSSSEKIETDAPAMGETP